MYNFVMIMHENRGKNREKVVELLAPAKDKACAFAAINAGADAIYIGAQGFGARKKAANSIEDIKEIVEYAHKFLVKIYVTVNTIIYDDEIETVQKLIWDLYEIGIDAIIIQDMGILEMTKTSIPPIPIHASTQCNNDTLEKIKFLESCNIERVVLPREFSLKEIENIKKNTSIELETFIHGALCVCYSGQCYLSASIGEIGKRSANRGECAQPCRKKYSLVDENGKKLVDSKYLLSMKDLCMKRYLKDLIDIGVASFKIEGRLKDEDYVKNVVSYYRKKIDEISPDLKPSVGRVESDFSPDINKTFNRGYTTFFDESSLINPDTPKFTGEFIGKVRQIDASFIEVNTKKTLNVSDGIVFFDKNNELQGTTIKTINKSRIQVLDIKGITVGTEIYRNSDAKFLKALSQAKFSRKIPVTININKVENGFEINIEDYSEQITKSFGRDFEKAQNTHKAKENLKSQFSKLGESEFVLEKINISEDFAGEFDLFIPISELNAIRRDFIKNYSNYRLSKYPKKERNTQISPVDYPVKELDYSYNVSNKLSKEFYESVNAVVNEEAFELSGKNDIKGKTLMVTKHCIKKHLNLCDKKTNRLFLVDEFEKKYELDFDCKNCRMRIVLDE